MVESHRVLIQLVVVMVCCTVSTLARVASSSLAQDDDVTGPFFTHSLDTKRNTNQEDISKLLLKHLRFRQLPETGLSMLPSGYSDNASMNSGEQVEKRKEQRMLVNNLAALLSGLRDRQAESNMRMPSLRFGK